MKAVIIAAGGEGSRTGLKTGKQFYEIGGKPVVVWTIEKFLRCEEIDIVLPVVSEKNLPLLNNLVKKYFDGEKRIMTGATSGSERLETVFNGLIFLKERLKEAFDETIVLVHDGARPFVSVELIKKIIEGAEKHGACVPVVEVPDTLKVIENDFVVKTIDRTTVRAVQTPQGFRASILYNAYVKAFSEFKDRSRFTDDASIVEEAGTSVFTVSGERLNFKITYPEDIFLAELLLERSGER